MTHQNREELEREAAELFTELEDRRDQLKPPERLKIPPQPMPEQDPAERVNNINEVGYGYTEAQARVEAMRCLQCKNKPCVEGCPVRIEIPAFIQAVVDGDFEKAAAIIKQNSLLPAVCGRVCPQETQCQEPCTVGKSLKDQQKSVEIGRLERFVADWERENKGVQAPSVAPSTGRKVAVVGSGPASLVVAADVRRQGHDVTVLEAFHKFGGVMIYGIPEFRLAKSIVKSEIETLEKMGVELIPNFVVGRTRKLQDLISKDGYDAVFIGVGAGLPSLTNVEGENLVGVFSANEYLTRANLMRAYDKERAATPIYESRKVAVLGGGNVAMDAARMARRLGAEEVHVIYRRSEAEMPARVEEVEHAKEEGIELHTLRNIKRVLGTDDGRVRAMELLKFELGEPDDSGRRRPVAIEGSEHTMDVDTVIVAIGNQPNPLIKQTCPELETDEKGRIVTDEDGQTSLDRVYAGGDIVLGAATVILAMGEGRKAAATINRRLAELSSE
ncbi:MAG: NADPH-dependent glutamate synthase [Verrucomicrobiota bacterium]